MNILPLTLKNVTYYSGGKQLLKCNVTISEGPNTMVLGPNGAGKSIFLRVCHGLLKPTEGQVEWTGKEKDANNPNQAMVFQKPIMLQRTAEANLAYGLKLRKATKDVIKQRVSQVLQRVGLTEAAKQLATSLSAGEQQRLALGRAWVLEPDVLFLDEPTANLDPGSTAEVEIIIQEIKKSGTKIVMTTHDLGQARRLGGDIIFLYGGTLKEHSPAEKFFDSPKTKEARAFLNGEILWGQD